MHKLFRKNCDFKIGATSLDHLPESRIPEVAFVGRSNVGKSSLLNALTGQNSLARTSKTPGCTQQLNLFTLGKDQLNIVDLPGYGYAKYSRKEVNKWGVMIMEYLRNRSHLERVYLLIDSRHNIKDSDTLMMNMLDKGGISYQVILTKIDKSSRENVEVLKAELIASGEDHPALHPEILDVSSHKGTNIESLREILAGFAK